VVIGRPQARVGLYRSRDGGATWALLWAAPLATEEATAGLPPGARLRSQGVKDLVLDPRDPETIYVSAFNAGVFRSSPRLEGGDASFKPVFALIGATSDETAAAAIAIAVHDGRTRVWAGNGVADRDAQGVYRADAADVPARALAADTGAGVVDLPVWHDVTSGDPDAPGYATHAFCASQCGYDQVLAAPPGAPDTIYVGGSAGGLLGDPVVRSADAGETFSSFGFDAAADVGLLHGDIHAIAFDPDDPSIVFVASDGGLARSSGDLADGSALCTSPTLGFAPDDPDLPACVRMLTAVPERFLFLNRGLATLQFYSVAADPRDPLGHVLGGTQDNATVALDPAAGRWSWLLPVGDGVAGGFHPTRTDVVFAGANDLNFYTLEDAGPGTGTWVWTSGPIRASEEATSISPMFTGRQFFTIDPARPDTQFTGAEHVWRTTDDGGDPGFLEAHCVLFAIDHDFRDQCGDWTPLGRKLTDASWGDREGGVVAAAARTAGDSGTLWAATSTGRLFVSRNADAPDPAAVAFRRIDSPLSAAPNRFPSAIVADPAEPRRAWIAYSGFNALTPDRPGHVFEVTIAADGSSVQWISLDANLGDLPIDHLVRDDRTGDLYAATDFGVLVRGAASGAWAPAGTGLPDVLTPFLEILPADRLLLAATHGLGIWYRRLPPAP
ncbi:MAG TPA: hypothetical protein VG777_03445, partial [Thermoanaerobaculia bacterium]|nr:hypothetical protein [Thermoanaerobaculia bacterium]